MTKNKEKFITIYTKLKSPEGKSVDGVITIKNEWALFKCADPNLAKELYEADKKDGIKGIVYNQRTKTYLKYYKNTKKEKIAEEIKEELKKAGGSLVNEVRPK